MATKRLKDFPAKSTPTGADIVFIGDAANTFREVKSTISEIISGYSSSLASIAGLSLTANQMIYTSGVNTFAATDISPFGRSLVAANSALNAQSILELVIGLNVQAWNQALDSIAGLTTSADQMLYTTGTNIYATTTITAFGRNLVASVDGPSALTTLGAVAKAGDTMSGFLTLNADPTSNLHAATKQYVDSSIGGTGAFLRVANNLSDLANVATARTNLGLVIGTNVQAYDATLQSISALGTASDKTIYTTGVDTWAETTLTSFARTILDDVDAASVRTTLGLGSAATQSNVFFLQTANNLSDVVASTARTNLGLGSAAIVNVPISSTNGGTGVSNPTAHTIPIAEGAANFNFVGPLTNGQLIIGSTGADPVAANLTAGANISISNSAGNITISTIGPGSFGWTEVTATTQAASSNAGYITNNAALVTVTLPATSSVGDELAIVGKGAGGWKLAQNTGQQIHMGQSATTSGTGGALQSTGQFNSIWLVCTIANTTWTTLGAPQGNISVT